MIRNSNLKSDSAAFQVLEPVGQRLNFRIEGAQCRRMAPLAQLNRRCPLVKLSQQSGFNLLKLFSNPLLVFVGQHSPIIRVKI